MNIREFGQNLQSIYDEMWRSFSEYQRKSGLHCLEACGRCCVNPDIEASVLEMIPAALRALDDNKLEYWLERLENSDQDYCLMYEPHSPDKSKGSCTIYHQRPSLCRMFGVAGYYNKHQKLTLSVCKFIKERYPDLTKIRLDGANEENTPILIRWAYLLSQLDPAIIQKRMPINQAFKLALEKVALYAQYQQEA